MSIFFTRKPEYILHTFGFKAFHEQLGGIHRYIISGSRKRRERAGEKWETRAHSVPKPAARSKFMRIAPYSKKERLSGRFYSFPLARPKRVAGTLLQQLRNQILQPAGTFFQPA